MRCVLVSTNTFEIMKTVLIEAVGVCLSKLSPRLFVALGLALYPTVNSAQTISCGQQVTGQITNVSQRDAYFLTVNANDRLRVRFQPTATNSGNFQPQVLLYDSGGNLVTSATGGSVDATLSSGGQAVLFVAAQSQQGTGRYEFSWQRLSSPCNAAVLACGQVAPGTVDYVTAMKAHTLAANAGDRLRVRWRNVATRSGNFNPFVELFDSAGDSIGSSTNGVLEATVPVAGPVSLLASSDETMGRFRLRKSA